MKPLTPSVPHAIVMIGIPGAGKSTFAERFANTFQAPIINEGRLAVEAGISTETASIISASVLGELLKTNRTIIIEGATDLKTDRLALKKRLNDAGYQTLFVWVQTDSNEALRRVTSKQREGGPMTEQEFDAAIRRFSPPTANENAIVISGKHTYTSQLRIVLRNLASHRGDGPPSHDDDRGIRTRSSRPVIVR